MPIQNLRAVRAAVDELAGLEGETRRLQELLVQELLGIADQQAASNE